MTVRSAPLILALLVAACASEQVALPPDAGRPSPCGTCPIGEACDRDKAVCVKALAEGAACTATAPATIDGACPDDLACGEVGSEVKRCSRDCTAQNAREVCGAGAICYARPGATGSGFCAKAAAEAQSCDAAKLTFCSGKGLSCITPNGGQTAGSCFVHCDPALATECGAGRSCADPFPADPTFGICVTPAGHFPDKCDHSALRFCGQGELCARPTAASFGYCHKRCTTNSPPDCAAGESCLEPETNVRFCARPVALNGHCATTDDRYCGVTDVCVKVATDTVCRVDCTNAAVTCPAGTTCSKLSGSERKACL